MLDATFYGLRAVARLTIADTADLLGVSARTVKRYDDQPPRWALDVLRASAFGVPVHAGRLWAGWRFGADGLLYSPEDWRFAPLDLLAQPFERQLLAELQHKLREPQQWKLI